MKKLLIRICVFVPLAAVGYVLLLFLLGDWGWVRTANTQLGAAGHLCSRAKDIRNYHDVDILFLGSSHCYRTFDTRYYNGLGYSCFNLGSSNQTPMQTYVLLQEYLDSLNPGMVVMEVHPDIMQNDGVESAVNMLVNVPITCQMSKMALKLGNMKALNTWLYSLYSQRVCHRLERFVEDSVINHYHYIPGGYCEVDTCEFQIKRYPRKPIKIRPEQLEALKRCLAMLKARGIPYLLVEIQDSEQLRRTYLNHAEFEQTMRELGPYRYELLPMIDTVDFFNSNHLSQHGIDMFNQDFGQYLIANYPPKPRLK